MDSAQSGLGPVARPLRILGPLGLGAGHGVAVVLAGVKKVAHGEVLLGDQLLDPLWRGFRRLHSRNYRITRAGYDVWT